MTFFFSLIRGFRLSPREELQGWWTGCRCSGLFPPVWTRMSSCIPRTPARTPGSPRWTPSAGTSGRPGRPLRRGRVKVNNTLMKPSFSFKHRSESLATVCHLTFAVEQRLQVLRQLFLIRSEEKNTLLSFFMS